MNRRDSWATFLRNDGVHSKRIKKKRFNETAKIWTLKMSQVCLFPPTDRAGRARGFGLTNSTHGFFPMILACVGFLDLTDPIGFFGPWYFRWASSMQSKPGR